MVSNASPELRKTVKPKKFRNMMYVQQTRFLQGATKESIIKHIEKKLKNVEYAYILHDKDVYLDEAEIPKDLPNAKVGDKKLDHIHIGLSFKNARTIDSVAKALGVPPQHLEKFEGRFGKANMFAYLTHKTEGARDAGKHEYDYSEVTSNFNYKGYIEDSKNTAESKSFDVDSVLAGIIKGDIVLKDFFTARYFGNVDAAGLFYVKHQPKIDKAINARYNILMSANGHTHGGGAGLEIIYIQGDAGSGKTMLAKEYAYRKYGDYFVSGSSNDTVQDYMGEPVAIFDDARPGDFLAGDWLKMLDPYTSKSTVTSRFYNKYLAVKCIILTTTIPFHEFFVYAPKKGGEKEPVSQFMRRFSTVIHVRPEEVNDENFAVGKVHVVRDTGGMRAINVGGNMVEYKYWYEELPNAEIRIPIPKSNSEDVAKDILSYF